MTKKGISNGVVHNTPEDLRKTIASTPAMHEAWEDITALARNEWICWVTSAKKAETRAGRITRAKENLSNGKRRPCCWAGCGHRG